MDEEIRQNKLQENVNEGNLIRAMCQHPGFGLLQKKFDEKVRKATARLLDTNTSEKDVMELRRKIQVWTEVMIMLKSLMLTGQYSLKMLEEERDLDINTPA